MTHLDSDTWARLRAGTLAPDSRAAVLRHLDEDCDACDEVVAGLEDPALDAAIDGALASLPPTPVAADSLVFHRAERRILERTFRPSSRRWVAGVVPLALAAGAALFFVGPLKPVEPGQRLKGEVLKPPALSAVISRAKGAPLEPLDAAKPWPASAELFFTYDLPQDAHVYLARVGLDGRLEAFYPPPSNRNDVEHAGLHSLTVGGTVQSYALSGLQGKQRFVLLASPVALEGAALERAFTEASASRASLEVEVGGW